MANAEQRRAHLERAIQQGGSIMTARGAITREVPSTSQLARTAEDRDAARAEIERKRRELDEQERALAGASSSKGDRKGDSDDGSDELSSKTVAELKELAKEKGIEGYSGLNKAELIAALEEQL